MGLNNLTRRKKYHETSSIGSSSSSGGRGLREGHRDGPLGLQVLVMFTYIGDDAQTGVYQLTIPRARKEDLFYIGSAGVSFGTRWGQHSTALDGRRHVNPRMQFAFNKYGIARFEILEKTSPGEEAATAEQGHLNVHFGKPNCLNLSSSVHNPAYCPEVRRRMKESQRARVPDIVVEFIDGESRVFPSQAKAASALGVHPAAVTRAIQRGIPASGGKKVWKLVKKVYRIG